MRYKIARSHRIAAILNGARGPVSAQRIAIELEVSERTITRDIKFMREELGLPIRANQHGHFFTKRMKLCPVCCMPIP